MTRITLRCGPRGYGMLSLKSYILKPIPVARIVHQDIISHTSKANILLHPVQQSILLLRHISSQMLYKKRTGCFFLSFFFFFLKTAHNPRVDMIFFTDSTALNFYPFLSSYASKMINIDQDRRGCKLCDQKYDPLRALILYIRFIISVTFELR